MILGLIVPSADTYSIGLTDGLILPDLLDQLRVELMVRSLAVLRNGRQPDNEEGEEDPKGGQKRL